MQEGGEEVPLESSAARALTIVGQYTLDSFEPPIYSLSPRTQNRRLSPGVQAVSQLEHKRSQHK